MATRRTLHRDSGTSSRTSLRGRAGHRSRAEAADSCLHTGRAGPGYDRVLLDKYAGLDLHRLRHSAATHLGEAEIPLQLNMGKTRNKNPLTAMRYVKPGAEAIAKATEVLAPRRRTH